MDGMAASGSTTRQDVSSNDVKQALRPLTIRQIMHAERAHSTAPFMLDNTELGEITIVAHLFSPPDMRIPYSTYKLEDGSGRITAKEWLSDENELRDARLKFRAEEPFVQRYVRVRGILDEFRGTKSIKVNTIRDCTDPHEHLFHFLECCAVAKFYETGRALRPPSTLNRIQQTAPEAQDITMDNTTNNMSTLTLNEPPAAVSPNTHRRVSRDPLSHLDTLQRGIIQAILNGTHTAGGVHVTEIARAVSRLMSSPNDISSALDYLLDEGYIECPVDVHHCTLTSRCRLTNVHYTLPAN
ncbi:hypothetical protein DAEQUDRAFT_725775 [Daedalea quercina L-15889]|uniref:Replication protein A C-terminal domain-containing protein n=1 Tax=Daedalea quercina L-15889 TaxID=1314783 RepID=A0A165R0I4_9APHY|nr:hypothetical protein DAEQUDRAFT_725775 [Daedalea quercina L-15889]